MRGQQLLLQAADRQHLAAQRDLAGHGHIGTHRDAGQHRHQRGRHGNARGRAILGRRSFGHVDVDVALLEHLILDAQASRSRTHHRARRLDRLLHHVAQRTRAGDVALARHERGFDGQQVAAHFRPGEAGHLAHLVFLAGQTEVEATHAQELVQVVRIDLHRRAGFLLQQQLLDHLAADLRDLALQRPHAGFTGVVADDVAQRAFRHLDLATLQTVVLGLLGQQVALGDVDLFVLGVARQPDHFHPVEQRRRDVQRVRRCHEHHVRQVEVHLDVVVLERVVLLRVQHFEQRRRRIAAEIRTHLVDLVEQEQRVTHADLGQALQNLARHRPDVGPAVTADFSLVTHAAQRHAHELAVRRTRHRLPERGLADTRRPHEAQDRRLQLVDALLHCEIFKDALLDLLQTIVILIQHLLGVRQVVVDLALLAPRQTDKRVDIVAHDRCLGRHRRHQLELLEFRVGLLLGLLGHARGLDLLVQLFEISALFAFAQFLLDGLDLLVQVVLALALLHLALDAAADALFHLQDVDLAFQLRQQALQTFGHIEHLEDLLLLLKLDRQMRGDGVGQTTRLVDARQRGQDLRRNLLVQLHVLVELRHDGATQRLGLGRLGRLRADGHRFAMEVRLVVGHGQDVGTLRAFDQHLHGAVRQFQHLQDVGDTTDLVEILVGRLILGGRLLGNQHDALARFHRGFQGLDGFGAPHEQRNHHVREHHHVAQRQQRQANLLSG